MLKIGFLINPIAGIGGKKAWKGTDLIKEAWEFFESGETYAFERVKQALNSIDPSLPITFYYCDDPMGKSILVNYNFNNELVFTPSQQRTTANDTQAACKVFMELDLDLILFVGGDGTARDVASVIGDKIPALGIPSGVKMFSGCFLYRPQDLGEILDEMVHEEIILAPEDVMDVNEELFRENRVQSSLFGQLIVPQKTGLIQGGKISSSGGIIDDFYPLSEELVNEYNILNGTVILGTGSTVYHIMKAIGVEKTLLGIDVLIDGEVKLKDVNEEQLHKITAEKEVKILLTPIGGQGFLLGRGNQQISSRVLNGISRLQFIVVSSEQKLTTIDKLEIDLEHPVNFESIKNGFIRVLVGYHQYKLKKINVQVN
ncbi:MAG: ATP-NAD kinase family protein [Candidatus Heimdallarchaeaceae archaeon]